jgi:glucosamine--fructose-6-phosphate aminotransferase (isomerizing)
MATSISCMRRELNEAADVVQKQLLDLKGPIAAAIEQIARKPPRVVVTCARGSSAHAATFVKHLIERHLGIPVAAAAPNIASVYRRSLDLKDQLFLAVSQSGRSDDLIETAAMARASGALTIAAVNEADSGLAHACELVLPLGAGPELSIAATKTFIASLAAVLQLIAALAGSKEMVDSCRRLPERLARAAELDWSEALDALLASESVVTIGRGPTLAIAREAALKLKETCGIHGEAFSAAEFHHGPITLVRDGYPMVLFSPNDEAAGGLQDLAADLRHKGADVFVAQPGERQRWRLPTLAPDQADADAICLIQSFYAFAENLAARRGIDVDRPRHLKKVTRTR